VYIRVATQDDGNNRHRPQSPRKRRPADPSFDLPARSFASAKVTAPELELHPASKTVHTFRHGAQGLAQASSRSIAIWLLVHGLLKLALAIELLRGKTWIFPVALVALYFSVCGRRMIQPEIRSD
jgi:Predicted membrane protein (DUF2127)